MCRCFFIALKFRTFRVPQVQGGARTSPGKYVGGDARSDNEADGVLWTFVVAEGTWLDWPGRLGSCWLIKTPTICVGVFWLTVFKSWNIIKIQEKTYPLLAGGFFFQVAEYY